MKLWYFWSFLLFMTSYDLVGQSVKAQQQNVIIKEIVGDIDLPIMGEDDQIRINHKVAEHDTVSIKELNNKFAIVGKNNSIVIENCTEIISVMMPYKLDSTHTVTSHTSNFIIKTDKYSLVNSNGKKILLDHEYDYMAELTPIITTMVMVRVTYKLAMGLKASKLYLYKMVNL